jgi:hypothetical protein
MCVCVCMCVCCVCPETASVSSRAPKRSAFSPPMTDPVIAHRGDDEERKTEKSGPGRADEEHLIFVGDFKRSRSAQNSPAVPPVLTDPNTATERAPSGHAEVSEEVLAARARARLLR